MSNGTPPPPPVPGTAPAKKGLPPLAWVGIGCGCLSVAAVAIFFVMTFLVVQKGKEMVEEATGGTSLEEFAKGLEEDPARTLAEMAVRTNPELDLLETDDEAGTITFRNNKTGEETTLNFEDIAEGRFSMTTDEGNFSIDVVDGAEGGVTFKGPEGELRFGGGGDLSDVPDWVPRYPGATDVQGTMHSSSADGIMGAFTGKSSDDAQSVVDHFKKVFTDEGYEIGPESMTRTGDGAFGVITGTLDDGRSINVMVIENADGSQVTINYNHKKQ